MDEVKDNKRIRKEVIAVCVIASLGYGICCALSYEWSFLDISTCLIWAGFFIACTGIILRKKTITLSWRLVIRLLFSAIIVIAIVWLQPWGIIQVFGNYAVNYLAVQILGYLGLLIWVGLLLISLLFMIRFTAMKPLGLTALFIIRLILLAMLVCFILLIVSNLMLSLSYSAITIAFLQFLDGFFTCLLFSIPISFVIFQLVSPDSNFGKKKETPKPKTEVQ